MKFTAIVPLLLAAATASPIEERQGACTVERQIAGVRQEIKTISSHDAADAALIPLALTATRTFFITPTELGGLVLPPVPAGVTGPGAKDALVALASILDANVPGGEFNGAKYTPGANNPITVDFVQTSRFALPRVDVTEVHQFDIETCEITGIVGYVRGDLIDPTPWVNEDDPDPLAQSLLPLLTLLGGKLPPAA